MSGFLVAMAAAVAGRAQCSLNIVNWAPYGSGCPSVNASQLSARLLPPPCALDITMRMPQVTNHVLLGGWIGLSLSPQQTVFPALWPCARMSNPAGVVFVGTGGLLRVNIPPGLQPFMFFCDAVALYQDTTTGGLLAAGPLWGLQLSLQ
jgi:hypothetical protein